MDKASVMPRAPSSVLARSATVRKGSLAESANAAASRSHMAFINGGADLEEKKHESMMRKIGASFQNAGVAEVARLMKIVSPGARWMVDPSDRVKRIWSPIIGILVLYSALVTPFTVAFRPPYNLSLTVVDYLVDFIFFLDVLMNARSSYYDNGVYVCVSVWECCASG